MRLFAIIRFYFIDELKEWSMPIYEYQCTNCHHTYELIQKMSDAPNPVCPQCEKSTAVRLVSAAGFQLKGTGWYVTDFKNKGMPKEKSTSETSTTEQPKTTTTTTTTESASSSGSKGDDK